MLHKLLPGCRKVAGFIKCLLAVEYAYRFR